MSAVITRCAVLVFIACTSPVLRSEVQLSRNGVDSPQALPDAPPAAPATANANQADDVTEIVVQAPEPRYVAATRRDQIGRIWAPVRINGKGPFRLVLDTGASASGVIDAVATALGLVPDTSATVRLQAVTGAATVPTIKVDSLLIGNLVIDDARLPMIPDALGGAEGVLGSDVFADRRIYIDFRHDLISITRSHYQRAPPGFMTVPFTVDRGRLLVVRVELEGVPARAIIDTGGELSVGNMALRDALLQRQGKGPARVESIGGVTPEVQLGERRKGSQIEFGPFALVLPRMTFADARIFDYWKLTAEPALLIGMDVLGLLDTLIIDYRLQELQLRLPAEHSRS
jgi:hypothetical protein